MMEYTTGINLKKSKHNRSQKNKKKIFRLYKFKVSKNKQSFNKNNLRHGKYYEEL